jgi:hypothetical protein
MGDPRPNLDVTCDSGHKGDERPVRFRLGAAGDFYSVIPKEYSFP